MGGCERKREKERVLATFTGSPSFILLILIACGLQLMAPWTSPPAVFISPSACLCLLPGASGGWDSRL
ncbi:rCG37207, isoform CRA_b [Rattus norvegicus]|uniref:RCG37207, isoform CRA_b n=1 Tax=Rattus norvegicus TaxID=10116 RepID=A6HUF7_RAT|nr:rCG37207, isoform CRA_b [Rattus norvegicus]